MDFFVLILGSDANAYYMARCCYEAYKIKPHLIGQRRLAFTKFSNILTIEYCQNFWQEDVFIKTINDFANKNKKEKILLISTNETYTEYISKNKDKLNKKFVYNLPSIDVIKTLTNKETFYKTYEKSCLCFPKTIYFDAKKENSSKINIQFPLVIKPANVVKYNHISFNGKNKIYKVNSKEELEEILTNIKESDYDDKLIIQEFIPGDDSYLFDSVIYSDKNSKCKVISFAQIGMQERTKSMVGNAAVLINGMNTYDGNIDKQINNIVNFMDEIGYKGFAEVDMKYDYRDKKFKVLEINARQGRCSYYITPLGCNLVKVMVDDLIFNKTIEKRVLKDKVLLSFVPKGIIRKYCQNQEFKKEALKLWKKNNIVKPMECKYDKNFKRFLLLRKRWLHYYKEYKNSYWK